jgi:hypothetical protein
LKIKNSISVFTKAAELQRLQRLFFFENKKNVFLFSPRQRSCSASSACFFFENKKTVLTVFTKKI